MKKILEKSITHLKLEQPINNILQENNILIIDDLWKKTRKDLKNLGLSDINIKSIIIKLELLGIDLGKKKNK